MCGRYIQTTKTRLIKKKFNIKNYTEEDFISHNISPSKFSLIITNNKEISLEKAKWGFSFYDKIKQIEKNVINSRIETINTKVMFKDSYNSRKCIIPANGYYEWQTINNKKIPYFIHIPESESINFAGIWKYLNFNNSPLKVFTIITKTANDYIKKIHERMPILLSNEESHKYLNDKDNLYLNKNFNSELEDCLEYYSVSKFVNNPLNDTAECIKPIIL